MGLRCLPAIPVEDVQCCLNICFGRPCREELGGLHRTDLLCHSRRYELVDARAVFFADLLDRSLQRHRKPQRIGGSLVLLVLNSLQGFLRRQHCDAEPTRLIAEVAPVERRVRSARLRRPCQPWQTWLAVERRVQASFYAPSSYPSSRQPDSLCHQINRPTAAAATPAAAPHPTAPSRPHPQAVAPPSPACGGAVPRSVPQSCPP